MNLRRICDAAPSQERVQPKSKDELEEIIEKTIKEKGNNCDLNFIDTSLITNMYKLFYMSEFNGDISKWDTSNVKYMNGIFYYSKFNGDISKWDTSNVIDMSFMFAESKFTGDISNWNVSKVKDMDFMFFDSKFNGDISNWNVSNVTTMYKMFLKSKFNGNISNWDVSNVKDMYAMFADSKFNGDISNWDVSSVTSKSDMFENCPAPIPSWYKEYLARVEGKSEQDKAFTMGKDEKKLENFFYKISRGGRYKTKYKGHEILVIVERLSKDLPKYSTNIIVDGEEVWDTIETDIPGTPDVEEFISEFLS